MQIPMPSAAKPQVIPQRPPVGVLPLGAMVGTSLVLPARTGFNELTDKDYTEAAKTLGCETRMIRAMALKEGKDHGFDELNRPVILFEPLHFAGFSKNRKWKGKEYDDLLHLQPKPHLYGSTSAQWNRLQRAYALNPEGALKATSWGKFQVLGSNCIYVGFARVESFISAMCSSEQNHLAAFVAFIQYNKLQSALVAKDWDKIADVYNGHHYKASGYDKKLKLIYESLDD